YVFVALGVLDQHGQQVRIGGCLRRNDDGQRLLLRTGGRFQRLIQLRSRTFDLAQFVVHQASCLAVSRTTTYCDRSGDILTIFAASANRMEACSLDWAALNS